MAVCKDALKRPEPESLLEAPRFSSVPSLFTGLAVYSVVILTAGVNITGITLRSEWGSLCRTQDRSPGFD